MEGIQGVQQNKKKYVSTVCCFDLQHYQLCYTHLRLWRWSAIFFINGETTARKCGNFEQRSRRAVFPILESNNLRKQYHLPFFNYLTVLRRAAIVVTCYVQYHLAGKFRTFHCFQPKVTSTRQQSARWFEVDAIIIRSQFFSCAFFPPVQQLVDHLFRFYCLQFSLMYLRSEFLYVVSTSEAIEKYSWS
jgi:hypothetical protein